MSDSSAPPIARASSWRSRLLGAAHRVGSRIPARLGGQMHLLPTRLTLGLTGPFNGQRRRVAAVAAMFDAVPFAAVIETGTFRALTTLHLRRISEAPIATVEVNRRYYEFARRRLSSATGVVQFLGDSPAVLEELSGDPVWLAQPTFFYLDAHWEDNLPLLDELRVIRRHWQQFAALIDDFRVDGDEGYFFDDYGPGKTLALPLLDAPELADLRVFWPAAHSSQETGARRGWVVLASPGSVADALAALPGLRDGGVLSHSSPATELIERGR